MKLELATIILLGLALSCSGLNMRSNDKQVDGALLGQLTGNSMQNNVGGMPSLNGMPNLGSIGGMGGVGALQNLGGMGMPGMGNFNSMNSSSIAGLSMPNNYNNLQELAKINSQLDQELNKLGRKSTGGLNMGAQPVNTNSQFSLQMGSSGLGAAGLNGLSMGGLNMANMGNIGGMANVGSFGGLGGFNTQQPPQQEVNNLINSQMTGGVGQNPMQFPQFLQVGGRSTKNVNSPLCIRREGMLKIRDVDQRDKDVVVTYSVLTKDRLSYFVNAKDESSIQGSIELSKIRESLKLISGFPTCFTVKTIDGVSDCSICAESEDSAREWINAITQNAVNCNGASVLSTLNKPNFYK